MKKRQKDKIVVKKAKWGVYLRRYWTLYLLLLLPMTYFVIFKYIPMSYIQIAFKKYSLVESVWDMEWAGNHGFEYFIKAFQKQDFINALRNTVTLNLLDLVVGFPAPIILALILNELVFKRFKKVVQTVVYMPHFLSMIIVCGILQDVLSVEHGIINDILVGLHIFKEPLNFFSVPKLFWWIVGFTNVWKETGWNSIIYLSAITSINPDLYEAASIDGAGRLKKMFHITLPGIKPTIFILLLINIGNVLNAGFEIQYLLSNAMIVKVSQTIDIYVLKFGINNCDFSLGTAAGIFRSLVSILLIVIANAASKAAGEERLF